jgi:hypothetical protein
VRERVEDVSVITDIEGSAGLVAYRIEVIGKGQVELDLLDEDGKIIASGKVEKRTLRVESAKLWQPVAAYLYKLRIQLLQNQIPSNLVDVLLRAGFRLCSSYKRCLVETYIGIVRVVYRCKVLHAACAFTCCRNDVEDEYPR